MFFEILFALLNIATLPFVGTCLAEINVAIVRQGKVRLTERLYCCMEIKAWSLLCWQSKQLTTSQTVTLIIYCQTQLSGIDFMIQKRTYKQ